MSRTVVPVLAGLLLIAGCDAFQQPAAPSGKYVRGGDAAKGLALVASGAYGCAACHTVPQVRTPRGNVGPPLQGMAGRAFIAGELPNKPGILVAFLRNPPALVPNTGMPDVGLTSDQARDIAAFLYTLEPPDAL